ncbi:hypothetical protein K461DRAFT_276682 [Myriangium duriaei CBS 260.36]|uniref:Piwi domain-containing protein n=1 Tax=Myriangium duriaei CBS 260.36 TaxID=1168546 RepID=A0A9P4J1A5_9PEZI|nr:hypothetical protein K461DRAFT_276682 [Myriangium duriaei CBS 260.36]
MDQISRDGPLKPSQNAAEALEELTHNMCYLFARATKAVSICPPVYHVDLACTRVRAYLSAQFEPTSAPGFTVSDHAQHTLNDERLRTHVNLKDSMFYI